MLLYHGSNVPVKEPHLIDDQRNVDFGPAFYLTSDMGQARRWARLKTERRGTGQPVVSVFEIDEKAFQALRRHVFAKADGKWLRYVASNRRGLLVREQADIVIGPVANDQTTPTIAGFLVGTFTVAETIRRLRPQQLKDQYAFRTAAALEALHFKELQTP